jgi:hypothetical protein
LRIALAGKMAAGKSTAAKELERLGFGVVKLAAPIYQLAEWVNQVQYQEAVIELVREVIYAGFGSRSGWADGIACKALAGLAKLSLAHRQELEDYQDALAGHAVWDALGLPKPAPRKPRAWMQAVGTEVFRKLVPGCWTEFMISRCADDERPLVCDDMRFRNEGLRLGYAGWKLVRVDCPEEIRLARVGKFYGAVTPTELGHSSETELDTLGDECWSYVLDCSGTPEEEAEAVRRMVEEMTA